MALAMKKFTFIYSCIVASAILAGSSCLAAKPSRNKVERGQTPKPSNKKDAKVSNKTVVLLPDEQRLIQAIFAGYDRQSRPVRHHQGIIQLKVGISITQIFELDSKNQVLVTQAWLNQEWKDENLVWDPSNFGGISMIRLPATLLWLPDLVLYNNAAGYGQGYMDVRVMLSNDGTVFWSVPTKTASSCSIHVDFFPFDQQICHLKYGSWVYDGYSIELQNFPTGVDLTYYMANGEWDLVEAEQERHRVFYTCCIEPYYDVTFYLHLRRRPLYYVHNIFFPCFIMSIFSLIVFLLPPESGEKSALGITVMLSLAVFMLTVTAKLPETSESIPLISIYLAGVMSMTCVSLTLTVIVLYFHHHPAVIKLAQKQHTNFISGALPLPVHRFVRRLSLSFGLGPLVDKLDEDGRRHSKTLQLMEELQSFPFRSHNLDVEVGDMISTIVKREMIRQERERIASEWLLLGKCLDRIFFWLIFAVFLFLAFGFAVVAPLIEPLVVGPNLHKHRGDIDNAAGGLAAAFTPPPK